MPFVIYFRIDKWTESMLSITILKLSFKIFCLTVYGHYLVLLIHDGVQNGCQNIICLTVCFSHLLMWLLKQVPFDNGLVEKGHTDIYFTQNDKSGGSKHTIHEIGQMSNEFKL